MYRGDSTISAAERAGIAEIMESPLLIHYIIWENIALCIKGRFGAEKFD